MANSRFKKNSGKYTCCDCGRVTRETGLGESDLELCSLCFEISGLENTVEDNRDNPGYLDLDIDIKELNDLYEIRDDDPKCVNY